jgi:biopolymer transport protein ExbB
MAVQYGISILKGFVDTAKPASMIRFLFPLLMMLAATPAHAWWNSDWSARRALTINTADSGAGVKQTQSDVPVLIRLHTGNFDFAGASLDGSDLRFVAGDDKTPLSFQIEKFDSAAEQALIWVRVPRVEGGKDKQTIWLYSGNENATVASDGKAVYTSGYMLAQHYAEASGAALDSSPAAIASGAFSATRTAGGVIGAGLKFDGAQTLAIPAAPKLVYSAATGMTVSVWVKPALSGQTSGLLRAGSTLTLALDGGKLRARSAGATVAGPDVPISGWSLLSVTLGGGKLTLYLNGVEVGVAAATAADAALDFTIGTGYKGELDELDISSVVRSADWLRLAAMTQGPDSDKVIQAGEAESAESGGGGSYFGVILKSVTLDGWVVIGVLMVMLGISLLVMAAKGLMVSRVSRANRDFLVAFHGLKAQDTATLDAEDDPHDADLQGSGMAELLFGHHDHHQNSTLYRVYHAGIQQVKKRMGSRSGVTLSPQALDVVKASLDASVVRENQKLNSLMVLLTIAISGGPFLGLLGTVVGVMITFAAIAATGDVNVAAIAPGIAAALVATVAGLAVAIPALFGYNYLGSRIKAISADMHVFVDEYIARIAETYSR